MYEIFKEYIFNNKNVFLKKPHMGMLTYRDKYKQNKYVFHNLQYNLFWHIYEIYFNDNIFIIVYFEILSFLYCYNFFYLQIFTAYY